MRWPGMRAVLFRDQRITVIREETLVGGSDSFAHALTPVVLNWTWHPTRVRPGRGVYALTSARASALNGDTCDPVEEFMPLLACGLLH